MEAWLARASPMASWQRDGAMVPECGEQPGERTGWVHPFTQGQVARGGKRCVPDEKRVYVFDLLQHSPTAARPAVVGLVLRLGLGSGHD